MLDVGCIYRMTEEVVDVSFLCSPACLVIGILDSKCCFTLQMVRDGFISATKLDMSHCIDTHAKSSILSAQPLLIAFCDTSCHVLVLDLSSKLSSGGVHFKGRATTSSFAASAPTRLVPINRTSLSLFELSSHGSLDTSSETVQSLNREETARCIIQSCRFDRGGSERKPSLFVGSQHKQPSTSSEALIVRGSRISDSRSIELIKVRFGSAIATVDLLRLHLSSRATGLRSTSIEGKVDNLIKYFDDLKKASCHANMSRKPSIKTIKQSAEGFDPQRLGGIESVISDLERGLFTRNMRRNGDAFVGGASAGLKTMAVSFVRHGNASVAFVKVVARKEAFVVPILDSSVALERDKDDQLGESIRDPVVYHLVHTNSAQCKDREILDCDDAETWLAIIGSCVALRDCSFIDFPSKIALESATNLTSSREMHRHDSHVTASNECFMGTLEPQVGIICMYHLPRVDATRATAIDPSSAEVEPICVINIKHCIPQDIYCSEVQWCITRVLFVRNHIIVCTAETPSLTMYRVVILRLVDYTVESVFALPDEDAVVKLVSDGPSGRSSVALVLMQTRLCVYCIRASSHDSLNKLGLDGHPHNSTNEVLESCWDEPSISTPTTMIGFMNNVGCSKSDISMTSYLQSCLLAAGTPVVTASHSEQPPLSFFFDHCHPSMETSRLIRTSSRLEWCIEMCLLFLQTISPPTANVTLGHIELMLICVMRIDWLMSKRWDDTLRRLRSDPVQQAALVRAVILRLSLAQPYDYNSATFIALRPSLANIKMSLHTMLKLTIEVYKVTCDLQSVSFDSALGSISAFSIEMGRYIVLCAAWGRCCNDRSTRFLDKHLKVDGSDRRSRHVLFPKYLQLSLYRSQLRNRYLDDHSLGDLEVLLCNEAIQYLFLFIRNMDGINSVHDPETVNSVQYAIVEILTLWQQKRLPYEQLEEEILRWIFLPPASDPVIALLLDAFQRLFFHPGEHTHIAIAGTSVKAIMQAIPFSSSFLMKLLRHKISRSLS